MYCGIDIGTSGVKVVLIDDTGAIKAQGVSPLSCQRPQPLSSEQDPDSWWTATEAAMMSIAPDLRRQVKAIGLSGQMHGATVLDQFDRPLRPAILWNDGRSHAECVALEEAEPKSRSITGNIAMPGFTAPKLLWLQKHEPELFDRIATVLLPKDYVRLCMTGNKASDMSDSAGTLWLDVAARRWSEPMLAATGLNESHMPTLYEGSEATGTLKKDVAERWGMREVPVAAGAGDNAAGAVGVGVVADGDAMLSLGTSGVIFAATAEFSPNPDSAVHAFCHCLPDVWHQMSVHLSAAACIDWAAKQLRCANAGEVIALAEQISPGTGPELFLPYLSGERTPHNDPHVRAAWLRLDNDTDPVRLASAVLEGVAFALADGLDALRAAGTDPRSLYVIGGGARSSHWGRIIASTLGVSLDYIDGGDVGPALGAARLARIAGGDGSIAEVCPAPVTVATIEPDSDLADRLQPKRDAFRAAYPALHSI